MVIPPTASLRPTAGFAGGLSVSASSCPTQPSPPDVSMPSPFVTPASGPAPMPASPWSAPASTEAIRASTDLHERLALGAKMLQALDVQLRRFEGSLGEQDAFARRIDAVQQEASTRLGELLHRVDRACEGFAGRLESLERNRLEQLDRRIAEVGTAALQRLEQEVDARRERLDAGNLRVTELEHRLLRLEESLGEVTRRFGDDLRRETEELQRRRVETVAAMHSAAGELVRLIEHSDGVRRGLEEDLRQRAELLQRCRELDREIRTAAETSVSQARIVADHLQQGASGLQPRLDQAGALAARLDLMLESLREWRPLLDADVPAQFRRQAEGLFAEGSHRFREQLERVSAAFQSLTQMLAGPQGDVDAWSFALGDVTRNPPDSSSPPNQG